jgi:hypothetical protein
LKTRIAKSSEKSTAHLGFEAKLWLAADKLRNNMDAAEYKHVVLGLIFLKYISDSAIAETQSLHVPAAILHPRHAARSRRRGTD